MVMGMDERIAINRAEVSWSFWEYLCIKCKADPFKTKEVLLYVSGCYSYGERRNDGKEN